MVLGIRRFGIGKIIRRVHTDSCLERSVTLLGAEEERREGCAIVLAWLCIELKHHN